MSATVRLLVASSVFVAASDWHTVPGHGIGVGILAVGFADDARGWRALDGGLQRTTDAGVSLNDTGPAGLFRTSLAALKGRNSSSVVAGGVGFLAYTDDGASFKLSAGGPAATLSVKAYGERFVAAGTDGPCVSTDRGATFQCFTVPLKAAGTGRYASLTPSSEVMYFTAGATDSPGCGCDDALTASRVGCRCLSGEASGVSAPRVGYTAEVWKTSDGGNSWTNLFYDEGAFAFNDIDCIDEEHCVAVGAGLGAYGSIDPGGRVYGTSNGRDFALTHMENATGTEMLMAAKMLSPSEVWLGGTTSEPAASWFEGLAGAAKPILALHSTDGGKRYTNEGGGVLGMIMQVDFLSSGHGFASCISPLYLNSLLEYGAAPAIANSSSH